jgi:hypothetical protein
MGAVWLVKGKLRNQNVGKSLELPATLDEIIRLLEADTPPNKER